MPNDPRAPDQGASFCNVTTPVLDLSAYLEERGRCADSELSPGVRSNCEAAWVAMRDVGLICVFNPQVNQGAVDAQQLMLERYFDRPIWMRYPDEPDDGNHQVGWTPPYTEMPLSNAAWRAGLTPENAAKPLVGKDPKERWMHPVGPRPEVAPEFQHLNRPPVMPRHFREWLEVMNGAGQVMLDNTWLLLEVLALGRGLPRDTFTSMFHLGTHLLAPTGSNLSVYRQPGTVLFGAHDDLGGLTGHFQANVPGCLRAWTRTGRRFVVRVPRRHTLHQVAQEMEWVTGGELHCGMHEGVVPEDSVDPGMEAEIQRLRLAAHAAGHDLWRVTTTLFGHIRSDCPIYPLEPFATPEAVERFPRMLAGEHLARGIQLIGLSSPN